MTRLILEAHKLNQSRCEKCPELETDEDSTYCPYKKCVMQKDEDEEAEKAE